MQQKSEKFSEFSERTEALARLIGINLSDLPEKIGISASMFHAYRSGKYPISPKAWSKLEAAERDAESESGGGNIVSRETLKKGSENDESEVRSGDPNENPEPHEQLMTVLTRIAEALEALVETRQLEGSAPPTSSADLGEKSA